MQFQYLFYVASVLEPLLSSPSCSLSITTRESIEHVISLMFYQCLLVNKNVLVHISLKMPVKFTHMHVTKEMIHMQMKKPAVHSTKAH